MTESPTDPKKLVSHEKVFIVYTKPHCEPHCEPHCQCAHCHCQTKPPLGCYTSDQAKEKDTVSCVFLILGVLVIFLVVMSFIQFAIDDSEHVHHTHPTVWH